MQRNAERKDIFGGRRTLLPVMENWRIRPGQVTEERLIDRRIVSAEALDVTGGKQDTAMFAAPTDSYERHFGASAIITRLPTRAPRFHVSCLG
jgi:hypothetical protein